MADDCRVSVCYDPCPHCGRATVFLLDFEGSYFGPFPDLPLDLQDRQREQRKRRGLRTVKAHTLAACWPCGSAYVDGYPVADLTKPKEG